MDPPKYPDRPFVEIQETPKIMGPTPKKVLRAGELEGPKFKKSKSQKLNPFFQKCREGQNDHGGWVEKSKQVHVGPKS